MADRTKYYYLKIKENFFDSEDMKLLESMDNGYLYSNILMKMYLLSLKNGGKLMYKDKIPYNSKMLSTILNHNVDVLDRAIEVFKELNLIDILDSGAIFMLDIQNYIGKSSDEADRKRDYRARIENAKLLEMDKCPDICRTNCSNIKDRDKDKDIIRDRVIEEEINNCIDSNNKIILNNWDDYEKCECETKNGEKCLRRSTYKIDGKNYCNQHSKQILGDYYKTKKEKYGEFKNVLLTGEEYHKLEKSNLLPYIEKLSSYIASKNKKYKSHYATILTWSRKDNNNSNKQEVTYDII